MSRQDLSVVLHLFMGSARLQKKRAALTMSFNEAWIAIAILFAISLLALPLMKRAHIPDTAMGPGTMHGH